MVREVNFYEGICICIPTRRPPPVTTLESYPPKYYHVYLITDPDVEALHREFYEKNKQVTIVPGARGMGAQSFLCYSVASKFSYRIFFRMDDDLVPGTFVHKDGRYPDLEEVIAASYECLTTADVSLSGFVPTSNRNWLQHGFRRSFGIVHGGANLAYSSVFPHKFIDPSLTRCEDIYRTCAHRREDKERGHDGSTGRVSFIGFDKSKSTSKQGGNIGTININREEVLRNRQVVFNRFPEMISKLDDTGVRFKRLK